MVKGNVPMSDSDKKRLSRFKGRIRKMASTKISLGRKQAAMRQRGGFWGALLGTVLPMAVSALTSAITNK